jgi:hypothetical protein
MKNTFYTCLIFGILLASCETHNEFKENGVLVTANIARKEIRKSFGTKRSRTKHIFYVMYYTDPDKANPKPKEADPKKQKTVDELLESISIQNMKFGSFQGRELVVNTAEYEQYKEGDKIQIYYLKSDSTRIELKEYVDH